MKKRISIIVFIGLSALFFISSATNASLSIEPSSISAKYVSMMDILDKYLNEGVRKEKALNYLCGSTRGEFIRNELGKVKYNHIFNEIQSKEQIADIKQLAGDVKGLKDCDKAFRLWYDYDQKWYAVERNKKLRRKNGLTVFLIRVQINMTP